MLWAQEEQLEPFRRASKARRETKDSFRTAFGDLEFRSEKDLDDAVKVGRPRAPALRCACTQSCVPLTQYPGQSQPCMRPSHAACMFIGTMTSVGMQRFA